MARITHLNINHRGSDGATMNADDIPFTPAGSISSTNVQAAIEEVATEASGGSGPFEDIDTFNWKFTSPADTIKSNDETSYLSLLSGEAYLQGGTSALDLIGDKAIFFNGLGLVIPVFTSDPAGGDSEVGQIYYNSTSNKIRWYNGTAWAVLGHTHVYSEIPSGTINGSNAAFTVATTPASGSLRLYKNGLRQRSGSGNDYTLSGATITYESGNVPQTGDSHVADYDT